MKLERRSEGAVSEVVGVLLMLTITIILVSLVAVAMSSSMGDADLPIRATIVATGFDGNDIVFENVAGDSFLLDHLDVRLGVREDSTKYITLRGSDPGKYLESYSGEKIIGLGDRFLLVATGDDAGNICWGPRDGGFVVKPGQHLTYRFIDRQTGAPISSGELLIR